MPYCSKIFSIAYGNRFRYKNNAFSEIISNVIPVKFNSPISDNLFQLRSTIPFYGNRNSVNALFMETKNQKTPFLWK